MVRPVNEDVAATVALSLAIAAALAGLAIWLTIASRHRSIVIESSAALAQLQLLNDQHGLRLSYHPPLRYEFVDRVNSKVKYDRYDLRTFFLQSIGNIESEVRRNIDARQRDVAFYVEYEVLYDKIATCLGRPTTDRLSAEKFRKIEHRLYKKRKLRQPQCVAEVKCTVTYTSPQGQNSYARALGWDFDGLRYGIDEVKRIRDSRGTTQFLRQQERNKMSTAQRARIINRDNSSCQMCGAKVSDGVTLHVDHIVPVSRGGLTLDDNLQTLCQECNLGKSNRF